MNQALDLSVAFQIALTIVATLGGWLLKGLFEKIDRLEAADKGVAEMLTKIQVELPTHYVLKTDLTKQLDSLFDLLRRIEEKLDHKADRHVT